VLPPEEREDLVPRGDRPQGAGLKRLISAAMRCSISGRSHRVPEGGTRAWTGDDAAPGPQQGGGRGSTRSSAA